MITGQNYIGSTLSATGTKTYETFNPAANASTGYKFTEASEAEINQAAALAAEAYKTYSLTSGKQKAAFLNAIADELLNLGDAVLDVYVAESGLPRGRAEGERGRAIGQLRSFANLISEGSWVEASIDTAQPERAPLPKVDLRKMLFPLGPVVVFGSSNFPFAFSTAGGDTASALAAGCPVIVKSHPMHAATGEMVSSAIIKAAKATGMPEGVFSNLNSAGIEVGTQLVQHPAVKAVGFTGSIKGGRALCDLAANRPEPIPVFAEMGSINPVVLLPEALANAAQNWAAAFAGSITMGSGQFCTNPGLILGIKGADLDNYKQLLATEIEKIAPTCMLHPNIYNNYLNGKNLLSGQASVNILAEYKGDVNANFAAQTLLAVSGADFLANTTLHQEVFGPFSVVVECADIAELNSIIEHLEGQLTGSIIGEAATLGNYTETINTLQKRVGRIIFNGAPTGVEVCPAMLHGGPYPASSDARFTAVGDDAIKRWVRPVSYQSWPNNLLPAELQNENPLGILRTVDFKKTAAAI